MTLTVNNKTQYLEAGIDTMLNFARGDYANWTTRGGTKEMTDINAVSYTHLTLPTK